MGYQHKPKNNLAKAVLFYFLMVSIVILVLSTLALANVGGIALIASSIALVIGVSQGVVAGVSLALAITGIFATLAALVNPMGLNKNTFPSPVSAPKKNKASDNHHSYTVYQGPIGGSLSDDSAPTYSSGTELEGLNQPEAVFTESEQTIQTNVSHYLIAYDHHQRLKHYAKLTQYQKQIDDLQHTIDNLISKLAPHTQMIEQREALQQFSQNLKQSFTVIDDPLSIDADLLRSKFKQQVKSIAQRQDPFVVINSSLANHTDLDDVQKLVTLGQQQWQMLHVQESGDASSNKKQQLFKIDDEVISKADFFEIAADLDSDQLQMPFKFNPKPQKTARTKDLLSLAEKFDGQQPPIAVNDELLTLYQKHRDLYHKPAHQAEASAKSSFRHAL